MRHKVLSRRAYRQNRLRLERLEDRCLLSFSGWGQLPLAFEPNLGQAPAGADYVARGQGYAVELDAAGATLATAKGGALRLQLVGGQSLATGVAEGQLPGVSNYFVGDNPADWHMGVPTFGQVSYHDVYARVDLAYHGTEGRLEYDFVIHPGTSAGVVRLHVEGALGLSIDGQGQLHVRLTGGDLVQPAPNVYQVVGTDRRPVAGRFVLQDGGTVGFAVGAYDQTRDLVIDPVLGYSTFLGGSADDKAEGVAVDSAGDVFVAGLTLSTDFPTAGAMQTTNAGGSGDAFLAKLSPTGALLFSTYFGGSGTDIANGVALDSNGNPYLVGTTYSHDFPTRSNAFQSSIGGGIFTTQADVFVSQFTPAGFLLNSTYLGGSGTELGNGIAADANGVYVVGSTLSTNFPTAGSPPQATNSGGTDAFVAKLSPGLNILDYFTYVGGSDFDEAWGVAVDGSGQAYVAGVTQSTNYPTAGAPPQAALAAGADAFVTKINAAGSAFLYSTYLGGTGADYAYGIALDGSANAYIVGATFSFDFPTHHAYQASAAGDGDDAFVAELNSVGTQVPFSSYLGGTGADSANAVAYNASTGLVVAGDTTSTNFPTAGAPVQPAPGGAYDVFVTQIDPVAATLRSSVLFGGAGNDYAYRVAADSHGGIYVVGETHSPDFPTASPVQAYAGGSDAFVTKLAGHQWSGADVAVGSDGQTRLLWNTSDGRGDMWKIDSSLAATAGPTYGPLSGWTAKAEAAGSDGLTRILWVNTSGAAAVWVVDGSGAFQSSGVFGPISGWTAQDITVGSDNQARVLWTNAQKGKATVWTISNAFAVASGPIYGPYAGWTATRLAAGADGLTRMLWDNTNGSISVWLLNAGNVFQSSGVFGPISGWSGADIAVGSDNQARVLWTSTTGAAAVWQISNAFSVGATTVYGPLAGWTPAELTADSVIRLLWNNVDGTAALWLLSANGTFQNAATYGPF